MERTDLVSFLPPPFFSLPTLSVFQTHIAIYFFFFFYFFLYYYLPFDLVLKVGRIYLSIPIYLLVRGTGRETGKTAYQSQSLMETNLYSKGRLEKKKKRNKKRKTVNDDYDDDDDDDRDDRDAGPGESVC